MGQLRKRGDIWWIRGKLLQKPHIPMLVERNVRKGFFERAQFEAVRTRLAPMYRAVVTLAYYTGGVSTASS